MPQPLIWIFVSALLALGAGLLAWWWRRSRTPQPAPLPTAWTLSARPVFSADERRLYRQLREALPYHVVLAKLPLVRFSQPAEPAQVRYWYDLLGAIHVGFAVCSANGRVLAAIDLDTDRDASRRVLQIKQSVLSACGVRYLRCPAEPLPSIAELQRLVPQGPAAPRGPQPGPGGERDAAAAQRRERSMLWQDSGFFQDSFFGAPSRPDDDPASEAGAIGRLLRGGTAAREGHALAPGDAAADGDGGRAPPRTLP